MIVEIVLVNNKVYIVSNVIEFLKLESWYFSGAD